MRWVAQPLCLFGGLSHVQGVHEQHPVARHTCHLADCGMDVGEVMRRGTARDNVETRVLEGELLRTADDVRLHARRGIAGHDVEPRVTQTARDVATARRDVERSARAGGPGHEKLQVVAAPMSVRLDVRLRSLAPDVGSCRQLHGAPRAVEHRRLDVEVRRRSLRQEPPTLFGVRAVEANDDRILDLHLRERLQDPARDLVAARDPSEDVEEDASGPGRRA